MRSLLMFDLPTITASDKHEYRKFVKLIKELGFIMFQESIYIKLSINETAVKSIKNTIKNNLPKKGLISMLTITEKQFNDINYMLGDFTTDIINSDDRVIEL